MARGSIPPEVHGQGRFLLRRRDFSPAYLKAHDEGRLQDRVDAALSHLGPSCRACPRSWSWPSGTRVFPFVEDV
jgi:putative pyruvate formate lyase activating enzyme